MSKYFTNGIYFEDENLNQEFRNWVYERNKQLYNYLQHGGSKHTASSIFFLSQNTIRTMYKKYRHKYVQPQLWRQQQVG